MSQYKISKKRLAQIIKEEYDAAMSRADEGHGAFGIANRDEDTPKSKKKKKGEDERTDEAHCSSANRDEEVEDQTRLTLIKTASFRGTKRKEPKPSRKQ